MRNTIKNHTDFITPRDGPSARGGCFLVKIKPAKFPDDPRYGLMATKRTFRHAVDRNRAKRLLRDWISYNESLMSPRFDYIFIANASILGTNREDGRAAMSRALTHILHKYDK